MSAKQEQLITVEEAEEQVRLMARRMALLYHHIGEVLTDKYGMEKTKALLKEAVWNYGVECGQEAAAKVKEMGLPLTVANFRAMPDLPKLGWKKGKVEIDGDLCTRVDFCPLADEWLRKGSEELGRIYCYVDQAKYAGYNDILCMHLENVLDGHQHCLLRVKDREACTDMIVAYANRANPQQGEKPRLQRYEIPTKEPLSVMSIMAKIHAMDPSFACRTSVCYHGTCSSCLVEVNGQNLKGCTKLVSPGESVMIRPHSRYQLIKDVVVDFSPQGDA